MTSSGANKDGLFEDFQIEDLPIYGLPTPSTTLTPTDWTDQDFITLRGTLSCQRSRTSDADGLVAARKFLFWYAGLELPPSEVADCIQAMIDRVKIKGTWLMIDEFFGNSSSKLDISVPADKTFKPDWAFNYSREKMGDVFRTSLTQVTPAEMSKTACAEWFSELLRALNGELNPDEPGTSAKHDASTPIAYLAFLGLNLLRLATKSTEAVADHITQYTMSSFTSVYGTKPPVSSDHSAPPHASTLTQLKLAMDGNETLKKRVLYPPIFSFAFTESMNQDIRGFFVASFLLTVNCTGLSVLSWAERAGESLGVDRKTLCQATFTNTTGKFWVDYSKFLIAQQKQKSWPFARVFSASAFAHFAVSRNKAITAIFVAVATGSTKPSDPIWSADHLKSLMPVEIVSGIKYSNAAHAYISGPTKNNAKFSLGKAIAGRMGAADPVNIGQEQEEQF